MKTLIDSTRPILLATLFSCGWLAQPVSAAPSSEDWQAFNLATVEHHVIPRYQALSTAAHGLSQSTKQLCSQTDLAHLQGAQQAFQQTMDAWQGIQHIRSGPIETMMRNYSMQFWPDKKNHVGKHLDQLIASHDEKLLNGDDFYSTTVAVRGLPAIERLFFSEKAIKELSQDPYRCQVSQRIADYVVEMSDALVKEWQTDMLPEFKQTGTEESYYESNEEAAVVLLKPMVETLEVAKDSKILRVLGSSFERAKPRRLESWRSQRSLRNLQLNIAAIEAIYRGENNSPASLRHLLSKAEQDKLDQLFAQLQNSLKEFNQPMKTLVKTEQGYQALIVVADQIERLLKGLESAITDNGIFLGFNSQDGD